MIILLNVFCCVLCNGIAAYSFMEGNIGIGLVNLVVGWLNAILAVKNYNIKGE